MRLIVTFVIPVRHPQNSTDWVRLKSELAQTVTSICAQTDSRWRAVVVANHGADLPDMPSGFDVVRVDYPPNLHHDPAGIDKEVFYDAVRLDKGRRILSGMMSARDTAYYMVVDADDFISNRLVEYVGQNLDSNGWFFERGYIWGEGGSFLFKYFKFHDFCGTSLVVRSDLYGLPPRLEEVSEDYIKVMLGSHVKIAPILAERGTPLAPLPFYGAIYRVGHPGSHSQSSSLLSMILLNRRTLFHPWKILKNIVRMRPLTKALRQEFFGEKVTRRA